MDAIFVVKCLLTRVIETDIQRGVRVLQQRMEHSADIQLMDVIENYVFLVTIIEYIGGFS